MIKPVGPQLLIKIKKIKSTIELLPGTVQGNEEVHAVVEQIGTKCSLGVKIGHEVMFKAGTQPVVVESTNDYDLILIQEVQVAYIKNWSEEEQKES